MQTNTLDLESECGMQVRGEVRCGVWVRSVEHRVVVRYVGVGEGLGWGI